MLKKIWKVCSKFKWIALKNLVINLKLQMWFTFVSPLRHTPHTSQVGIDCCA